MRRIALVAAVLALLATGLAGAPARAIGCSSGELCLFENVSYAGVEDDLFVRRKPTNLSGFDNVASSVINSLDDDVILYSKRGARGKKICILHNTSVSDLSLLDFNDLASSYKVARGPSPVCT